MQCFESAAATGTLITLFGTPLVWKSATQRVVAQSTCEAEMVALASTAKELKYIRYLLMELGAKSNPVNLYCDITRVLLNTISKNGILTSKVKHVDIRRNFVIRNALIGICEHEHGSCGFVY